MNESQVILKYNDVENAIKAIRIASDRITRQGIPLWSPEELEKSTLRDRYHGCTFVSATLNDNLLVG